MTPNPCLSPSHRPRFGRFSLALLFCSSVALTISANAQEAKNTPPDAVQRLDVAEPVQTDEPVSGQTIELDKLVVTGSSIRGVSAPSSPLLQLDFEKIKTTGSTTTMDLMATLPQFSTFGTTPNVNMTVGLLAQTPIIHGLGTAAVLVLVDNHRLVGTGFVTNLPDPSVIPVGAIERMEIVTDGSSAIYGSDAVAGVVNIITRKNFNGTQVSLRYGFGDAYTKHDVNFVTGKSWDTGSFVLSYENQFHSNLKGRDRSYASYNQTARGGHDFRANFGSPGTVVIGGVNYALPSMAPGTQNLFDPSGYTDLYPKEERNSGMFSIRQKLTKNIEGFAQIFNSQKTTDQAFSQQTMSLTVNNTNPYFVAPAGTGATSETVKYWFGNEIGVSNNTHIETSTTGFTVGVNADLKNGWTAEAVGTFGVEVDSLFTAGLNQAAATAAVAGTTTATALNVFGVGPATSPEVIAKLGGGSKYANPFNEARQNITQAQLKVDGPLFQLPAGSVKVALGADLFITTFSSSSTYGELSTGKATSSHYDVSRRVTAAYGELYIPLFGEPNAMPGMHKLALSVAGRINKYNDGGTNKNPKLGLTWSPAKAVTLRGSYGTSFVAPNLWQSGSPNIAQSLFIAGLNTLALTGGRTDLVPQTATTYSAGITFNPTALPKLKVSLDYFDVDYENMITIPLGQGGRLFSDPGLSGKYLIYSPTAAQVAAVTSMMPVNGSVPAGGFQLILDTRASNLLSQKVKGFDFDVNYTIASPMGEFVPRISGTVFTGFLSGVPTAPLPSVLGTNAAVKWRGRAGLGWQKKPFSALVSLNYVDAYDNTGAPYSIAAPQKVSSQKTVDLHFAYDLPNRGWTKNVQVALDVQNLLDQDPPFFEVAPSNLYPTGYDATVSSPLGRVVSMVVTKKF